MIYNSSRSTLPAPENGRCLQQMVNHLKTLETKEERTKAAEYIIHTMSLLRPLGRETGDYKIKLWLQLYRMAGYELDIDSPYPPPIKPELMSKPLKPSYGGRKIKVKHYGAIVIDMIGKLKNMEEGEMKNAYVSHLAGYMKVAYKQYNDDKVNDDTIISQISSLSDGALQPTTVVDFAARLDPSLYRTKASTSSGKKKNKKYKKNR